MLLEDFFFFFFFFFLACGEKPEMLVIFVNRLLALIQFCENFTNNGCIAFNPNHTCMQLPGEGAVLYHTCRVSIFSRCVSPFQPAQNTI